MTTKADAITDDGTEQRGENPLNIDGSQQFAPEGCPCRLRFDVKQCGEFREQREQRRFIFRRHGDHPVRIGEQQIGREIGRDQEDHGGAPVACCGPKAFTHVRQARA
jgi:hypothetical protein